MFARFDENPAMTLQVIKETKRYGRTDGRTDTRTHGRTDGQRENSIPPTNKVCGGYNQRRRTDGQRENSIPPTNKVCGGYNQRRSLEQNHSPKRTWASLGDNVSYCMCALSQNSRVHAQLPSGATDLNVGPSLCLLQYSVYATREGSGKTAHLRRQMRRLTRAFTTGIHKVWM